LAAAVVRGEVGKWLEGWAITPETTGASESAVQAVTSRVTALTVRSRLWFRASRKLATGSIGREAVAARVGEMTPGEAGAAVPTVIGPSIASGPLH
jgi:hypothetical protein